MRRRIAGAVGTMMLALAAFGVTQGFGASSPDPAPSAEVEARPVPAPGATLTNAQVKSIEATALEVAGQDDENAPTMSIAGKTLSLKDALSSIASDTTAPEITDPRTGEPWSHSSVYLVTMQGHFSIARHVPQGMSIPTGTQLTLAIDVATGRVVSTQLRDESPPVLPDAVTP